MTKVKLLQIAYTSEWALAKFFPALFNGISNLYTLTGVCGKEESLEEARTRLHTEKEKRLEYTCSGQTWRAINTEAEIESLENILSNLNPNGAGINYYTAIGTNNNNSNTSPNLPNAEYDAVAVFTKNTSHLDFIESLIRTKTHIVCEKPLVVVTDKNHKPDRTQLTRLENIVANAPIDLVLMDAEHYSAKIASLTFYDNIENMVKTLGKITKIQGCTREIDDPDKERTRKLLDRNNQTGLLLDMGVHYFGIISNIDGNVGEITNAKYDYFPGNGEEAYNVETFVNTSFKLNGKYFHENASGEFTFAKFIDRLKQPEEKDKKEFKITFKNNENKETTVTINFLAKKPEEMVTDSNGKSYEGKKKYSTNEYHNILEQFYEAITDPRKSPITSFKRSIKNLDAIYRIYESFPVFNKENHVQAYKMPSYYSRLRRTIKKIYKSQKK